MPAKFDRHRAAAQPNTYAPPRWQRAAFMLLKYAIYGIEIAVVGFLVIWATWSWAIDRVGYREEFDWFRLVGFVVADIGVLPCVAVVAILFWLNLPLVLKLHLHKVQVKRLGLWEAVNTGRKAEGWGTRLRRIPLLMSAGAGVLFILFVGLFFGLEAVDGELDPFAILFVESLIISAGAGFVAPYIITRGLDRLEVVHAPPDEPDPPRSARPDVPNSAFDRSNI